MGDPKVTVKLVIDHKIVYVPYTTGQTSAEEACIYLCKHLGIGPVARHLFALRDSKLLHLMPAEIIDAKAGSYDFRIRYKVPTIMRLKVIDSKAFEYYFHQVRLDIIENKVLDIPIESNSAILLGLGVADMYRVMLEKQISQETVLNDYKKYIPKAVLNRHSIFVKRPIKNALSKLTNQSNTGFDALHIPCAYLQGFETMAPAYPQEEFKAVIDQNGSAYNIILRVSPFDSTHKGIKYRLESSKDKWQVICGIEEVCFISIRNDSSIEISRMNGIPFYVNFNSIMKMRSFVSVVDGYYRLCCKWTFNICKEVVTPSLQKLYRVKCHGPIGAEFSYAKLADKRSNDHGCFILRESEVKYNICYIDVCTDGKSKPKTYKLERLSNDEFVFNEDVMKYQTISQLMSAYNDSSGAIYLNECLPPSEYDNSPLLLCKTTADDKRTAEDSPICIRHNDLQIFSGYKKSGSRNITLVYKGRWSQSKNKESYIAIKLLNKEFVDTYLAQFIELAGQWSLLRSNVIVKFYGITLRNPFSMIMEYLNLGQLDKYLRNNKGKIQKVDLLQASANLASALWYLAENGVIHGKIRCKKLLVACHDESTFSVKLSDPGIFSEYTPNEIHWIPVEFYPSLHIKYARQSHTTDVWAFATTVHEIYMYGEPLEQTGDISVMKQFYINGQRLPRPATCPLEIYKILLECWDGDSLERKRPQEIMRDFNQILYQDYNSRQQHVYAQVRRPDTRSLESSLSMATETTSIASTDECNSIDNYNTSTWSLNGDSASCILPDRLNDEDTFLTLNIPHHSMNSTCKTFLEPFTNTYELDQGGEVILHSPIGQGHYGVVYKATLKAKTSCDRFVAVKRIKSSSTASQQEFEKEIKIMEKLSHKNIVKVLGLLDSEDGNLMVMEYVPHGSLQRYLQKNEDTVQDKQLLRYAADIAEGMDYLGQQMIVHRDLAARNILVVDENHVKISDFGLARGFNKEQYYIMETERDLPLKWYALESLKHSKFSTKSDVWSFGVTMVEMFLRGKEPFLEIECKLSIPTQEDYTRALERGIRIQAPPNCPQAVLVEVIYPCWISESNERPTFKILYERIIELLPQY